MPPKLKSHNFLKNDWTIGQLINTLCANEISRGWRFRSVSQGYPIVQQPPYYRDVMMGTMASQITGLTIVYSTVYSGAHQGKHQSSASLAFVQGSHRRPKNFPHKWPVTRKMLPLDDVIMQLCRYAGRLPTQSPAMRSLCRCHKFIMPDGKKIKKLRPLVNQWSKSRRWNWCSPNQRYKRKNIPKHYNRRLDITPTQLGFDIHDSTQYTFILTLTCLDVSIVPHLIFPIQNGETQLNALQLTVVVVGAVTVVNH